ncbi:helix-turn-helix domain-containing protein [Paraburkholderia aspalathi]|uniref:LysR family transcriptional regulator n=1 Tax=Paraburkholderia aspalathi TaxID=1324617 RepID=UPI001BA65220
MDSSSLKIFSAVATEQSVNRAARSLARVQSNVSTRDRQLEEELQVQLFSGSGKQMTLTPRRRRILSTRNICCHLPKKRAPQ